MKRYNCIFCNKKLLVANYKARKMHNNGTKHKQMVRTHYLEILEDEKIRKDLEIIYENVRNKIVKERENDNKPPLIEFKIPPMRIPKDFKIPPCPLNFRLPFGFDFENKSNFDPNLNEAIKKIKKSKGEVNKK